MDGVSYPMDGKDKEGKLLEGMSLWCAVFDGPVWWQGRDAFEQIQFLVKKVKEAGGQLTD
jgi:hypothetical protein